MYLDKNSFRIRENEKDALALGLNTNEQKSLQPLIVELEKKRGIKVKFGPNITDGSNTLKRGTVLANGADVILVKHKYFPTPAGGWCSSKRIVPINSASDLREILSREI